MTRRVDMTVSFTSVDASFSLYLGNDVDVSVTVLDTNGSPVDLTSHVVRWILKQTSSSITILLDKKSNATPSPTLTISDQAEYKGNVTFSIAATDTVPASPGVAFAAGSYYQEMSIVDASSKKTTVLVGTVTIIGVTI